MLENHRSVHKTYYFVLLIHKRSYLSDIWDICLIKRLENLKSGSILGDN